jgi:sugar phosphate isomerase/epimerase
MRLGFLTACMAQRELAEIAHWAGGNGFGSLEIAAWPNGERRHTTDHVGFGADNGAGVDRVLESVQRHDLAVSALAFYENNLHPDHAVRAAHHRHLRRCIDVASALRVPYVGTFVGRNPELSILDNLADAERAFAPLVEYAGERGVALIIENCVMERWDPDRKLGNLACTPELWDWMDRLGLGLNFDPSHLVWQGIDPVAALKAAMPIVRHVHAKDIELFPDQRNRYGFGGSVLVDDPAVARWWRFRMPGMGEIDWPALLAVLSEARYEGTVSIEHEDPVWDGTADRVEAGLKFGHATLAACLPETL